jgi:hypothetical protein
MLPRLARWAGVGVFVFSGLFIFCGDEEYTPEIILRVFYVGGGVTDFDALTLARQKYYEGIEADLCAFDEETGAIWVAKGYKVHKFDRDGRYLFGGVKLRAKATDIVVNQETHYAWVFREDGAISLIHPKGAEHNRPAGTVPLPHPHKGNTEYYLEPDNNRGGCWVVAKNELYYLQPWGETRLHKVYPHAIMAASAGAKSCRCWVATKDRRGFPQIIYLDRDGRKLREIVEGVREIELLKLVEARNTLWMVDKAIRNGTYYRDLRVMNTGGVLKAVAANVPPGPILAVDAKGGYGWYYGRTGSNVFLFEYDESAGYVYERLRLSRVGGIGRKAGGYTLIYPRAYK